MLVFISGSILTCFSQENKPLLDLSESKTDTLRLIFSSDSFSLEEEYIGDWGGYLFKLVFTKMENSIRVEWEHSDQLKNGKELDLLLPIAELNSLESIFVDCSHKLKDSKKMSTEHILYTFKNKNYTYIIDDHFTMECHDDFKAWKNRALTPKKKR